MKRLITGFGLTLALLATLGGLDFALAAGPLGGFPPKGQPQPGPDGNTPVWRAQLRVRVCSVDNAGTDNKVLAWLNGSNYTVMDIPANDFEQASDRTYDLLLTGVTRLADIHHLKVSKGGSDGICLTQLTLTINARQIYTRSYSQLWLDNTCSGCDFTTIPGSTLRAHSSWLAWTTLPRPRLLGPAEISSRLATAVGTGMYDFNVLSHHSLRWDDPGCSYYTSFCVESLDSLAIRVQLQFYFKCIDPTFGDGACGDVYVEYEQDLRFSCTPGGVVVATKENDSGDTYKENASAAVTAAGELDAVRQYVGPRLAQAFRNIAFSTCSPINVVPLNGSGINVQVEL